MNQAAVAVPSPSGSGLLRDAPGVRVKFCGLTRATDARLADALGVDAVGLVFYPPSPRAVTIAQALEIVAAVPPGPTRTGLFVDPDMATVQRVLAQVPLELLQFHGDEPAGLCRAFGLPYLKAIRLRPGMDVAAVAATFPDAFGLLLDAYRPGVPGGTGAVADWSRIPSLPGRRIVLAGGLHAANVGEALRRVSPCAVDVSSGIERSPGVKDPGRMVAFIRELRHATDYATDYAAAR